MHQMDAAMHDSGQTRPSITLVEVLGAMFGYGDKAVVQADEIRLRRGACLGIFGPNGSGKTTLIRGITGLLPPLSGSVTRRPVPEPGDAASDPQFGYLPQYRGIDLSWPMSGFDAAALAASARALFGWIGGAARQRVNESLRRLDVGPLARRSFATLSGGQQQRLLLAGALAAEPDILVLDEPTDGLDVRSRQSLLDLLRDLTARGLCTVIISHEVEDLLYVCNEVAWLHAAESAGQPSHVEMISPEALAERMVHPSGGA